jgi:superfamily I DNA and RNA helicase
VININITSNRFSKDELAQNFINDIEQNQEELNLDNSNLYYEFPMYKSVDEATEYTTFMIISPYHGIIMLQCDDRSHRSLSEEELNILLENLTQMYTTIFSNLIKLPNLRLSRTNLKFKLHTVLYLPNYDKNIESSDEVFIANNFASLNSFFQLNCIDPIDEKIIIEILSIIEGTKAIPKPKQRDIPEGSANTKGGILEQLEKEIATYDRKQKLAALTHIDGPQRIRGLAGSGKTIVLTMKAALLHLRNPDSKILYTFYTKSLYDHIRRLITRFFRMYEDHDPNWDNIHVRHAWGGASLHGVYYDACKINGIMPITYGEATSHNPNAPFDYVCLDVLSQRNGSIKKVYDYVLLDEGQDFEPSFYWLCRKLVKNDRLVWAYDELQNIMNVEMQETKKLFKNHFGDKGIDLATLQSNHPRQSNDIILHKSYRNPLEILLVAHSIGFGLYNDKVLQKLENKDHWEDIGYIIEKGDCNEGESTVISRPIENSPMTISKHQKSKKIISSHIAENMEEEIKWICKAIKDDLNENLLPEDILVVCTDNRYARRYFQKIATRLLQLGIQSHNMFDSYIGSDFAVDGSVTLSTVYKAKGNEAASVYVIGTDTFAVNKDNIVERNKLFTAFTRSKAWLTITGCTDNTNVLLNEINLALEKIPRLEFIYPGDVKTLRRELAEESANENKMLKKMQDLIEQMGLTEEEALELLSKSKRKKK